MRRRYCHPYKPHIQGLGEKAQEAEANLRGWLHYSEADWQDIEEVRCEAIKAWEAFFGI